jgi:stage III sporulation protein AB
MIKLIGAALILFSGAMIGFYQASQYAARPRQIRQLIQALKLLETEILYGFTPLPEALGKIGRQMSPPISEIFIDTADQLGENSGTTTTDAWRQAISDHWRRTAMKPVEEDIVRQLGLTLGTTDRDDQIKHLQLAVTSLRAEEEAARDDQSRYEKMWKSLGILTGALVVVLMY